MRACGAGNFCIQSRIEVSVRFSPYRQMS
jgi:hypothetical protein